MKICIVGLGLMGGSLALSLKRAGYSVSGYDISKTVTNYALAKGVIQANAQDFLAFDVVLVALPAQAAIDFIINTPFKSGAIVADICGVKKPVEDAVYAARPAVSYIGLHPMAGKEVSGVENACENLFDGANIVITRGIYTDERAFSVIKALAKDMGFKRLVECSAETHDRKIAYTSQLAHVVSNCYVNDGEIEGCSGFTGGSFQDMTRIAGVDEKAWAELYLLNADNLLTKCGNLINSLQRFEAALKSARESGNVKALEELLSVGAKIYRAGKENNFHGDGITVTEF